MASSSSSLLSAMVRRRARASSGCVIRAMVRRPRAWKPGGPSSSQLSAMARRFFFFVEGGAASSSLSAMVLGRRGPRASWAASWAAVFPETNLRSPTLLPLQSARNHLLQSLLRRVRAAEATPTRRTPAGPFWYCSAHLNRQAAPGVPRPGDVDTIFPAARRGSTPCTCACPLLARFYFAFVVAVDVSRRREFELFDV